jgi:hypothetical protein
VEQIVDKRNIGFITFECFVGKRWAPSRVRSVGGGA